MGQPFLNLGRKSGPYILPNNKNFCPRKFIEEVGRNYILVVSSKNHHSDMTDITTQTPIFTRNFASVLGICVQPGRLV